MVIPFLTSAPDRKPTYSQDARSPELVSLMFVICHLRIECRLFGDGLQFVITRSPPLGPTRGYPHAHHVEDTAASPRSSRTAPLVTDTRQGLAARLPFSALLRREVCSPLAEASRSRRPKCGTVASGMEGMLRPLWHRENLTPLLASTREQSSAEIHDAPRVPTRASASGK
ncbi:hypothetical protein HETIRDRAFT_450928 [Heterobasidion irregulare TC 32-1]|uniref:Uncharacterized protein n=1 Tax=Heterobasidion irregulare (strain TC 32-1) TaxID=747525 RepID=W4KDD8_HETIT|nr:uncharacterized protein HETIRDRAFT_450928 [Heterobasidion irregulare TC 32-1]ETW83325.1 hypothetical protein HETIRDRAFT_450928 [Heterobasidion irregulare TC 32-1]